MNKGKKALWVVFRPDENIDVNEMRKKFLDAYPHFGDMTSLYSKTWWVNEKKNPLSLGIYLFFIKNKISIDYF
jgi:hypothetical protein